jgi:hypothetical protein
LNVVVACADFLTTVFLAFGGEIAAVVLFLGIQAVLALLVALASAAAIPLVRLSAIMAGIRKAVGGGKASQSCLPQLRAVPDI